MPESGPREGTPDWILRMKQNLDLVTFEHMSRFAELLRAWVRDVIHSFRNVKHSFLKIRPGESAPTMVYDPETVLSASVLKTTRRHMEYHINLEFLRSGGVKYALDKLREAALIPRVILPRTLPEHARKHGFDNYAKVLYTFLVHYCFAQGLSPSSDLTRRVQTTHCYTP